MPTEQNFFDPNNPLKTKFFEGDAETLKHWVYLPSGNPPEQGWPVVLFLHGGGESATAGSGRMPPEVGIGPAIRDHPERFRCIVVFPQCDSYWDTTARQKALKALNATLEAVRQQQFLHDPNRISLTGLSWGGFGAWQLAAENPARFAALMVMCPWPHFQQSGPQAIKHAQNLEGMPVWVVQGAADRLEKEPINVEVPARVRNTNAMVEALKARGRTNVHYSLLPGVGHNCWGWAYDNKQQAIEWLLKQRRAAD